MVGGASLPALPTVTDARASLAVQRLVHVMLTLTPPRLPQFHPAQLRVEPPSSLQLRLDVLVVSLFRATEDTAATRGERVCISCAQGRETKTFCFFFVYSCRVNHCDTR